MGKRKKSSRKPMGPKKMEGLPTTFTCLFCNHEKSVSVKLDKKVGVGYLECKVCGQKFQCGINYLSAAVDVYGEWVDAADAVAKTEGDKQDDRRERDDDRRERERERERERDDDKHESSRSAPRHTDDDGGDRHYEGEGIVGDDEYD